jgi:signal transduction histidine kinase
MRYKLHLLKDKIIFKLAILIAIEVLLVVSSFGISTYIQSQSTTMGNTINVAGKNRFLTSNFLLELEKVNQGTAQVQDLRNAADALNTNILFLKSGGDIDSPSGDIFLTPLSAKYFDKWNEINEKEIALSQYVGLISQRDTTIGTSSNDNSNNNRGSVNGLQQLSSPLSSTTKNSSNEASIETIASQLIASSDDLTRQLGEDDRVNSQNLVAMQTIFIIGAVLVGVVILYVMKRLLRPISLIIKATEEVKKGNLAISPIPHCDSKDEVGVLAASFNSMIKKLAEYDKMQKEFINIAAHELRTPIQPILGLSVIIREGILNLGKQSQMMQGDVVYKELKDAAATTTTTTTATANTVPGPLHSTERSPLSPSIEKIIPMVDTINRNAKRLERMTNNLLDLSRIENNKSLELSKEKVDLRKKIENVINDMRSTIPSKKDVRIRFECNIKKASSVMVEGDKDRIFEVISNLLNNAIKFTEKGEVVIVLDEKDGQAIVSVRDDGCGIAPEIYPNLFTKFVTKSEKGTGLGLFISKNIIEAHDGRIWAENNSDGRGAIFAFSMPTLAHNTPL